MRPHPNTDDPVWYVAYGSNMSARRFECYIGGGRPRGGSRTYLGCRDPAPPRADAAVRLAGGVVFAGRSKVWGGGIAFYDSRATGEVVARAYQITFGQLSDLVAQETWRPVGQDLVLDSGSGHQWPLPSETYDTLVQVGCRDGMPMLTITSRQRLEPAAPSPAYLRTMFDGLDEIADLSTAERVRYLLRAPGVAPTWTAERLAELSAATPAR